MRSAESRNRRSDQARSSWSREKDIDMAPKKLSAMVALSRLTPARAIDDDRCGSDLRPVAVFRPPDRIGPVAKAPAAANGVFDLAGMPPENRPLADRPDSPTVRPLPPGKSSGTPRCRRH